MERKKPAVTLNKKRAVKKLTTKRSIAKKTSKKTTTKKQVKNKTTSHSKGSKHVQIKEEKGSTGVFSVPVSISKVKTKATTSTQLAVLSSRMFPVDGERLAMHTARYAGVFFVIMGAFFTLLHVQNLNGIYAAAESTPQQATSHTWSDCMHTIGFDDPGACDNFPNGSTSTVDTKPPVVFTNDKSSASDGIITLAYDVPRATRVEAYVFSITNQQLILLGDAVFIGNDRWTYRWDTTRYTDGKYGSRVRVTNNDSHYFDSSDTTILIENIPLDGTNTSTGGTQTDTATSTNTGTTTTNATTTDDTTTDINATATTTDVTPTDDTTNDTVVTTTTQSARIEISESTPDEEALEIFVFTNDAQSIKIFSKKIDTGNIKILGFADFFGDNEWKYVWQTKEIEDGNYEIKAQVITSVGNFTVKSNQIIITNTTDSDVVIEGEIDVNADADAETDAKNLFDDLTHPDEVLAPDINIKIINNNEVEDRFDILVSVTDADFIELYAIPSYSLTPHFLGLAQQRSATEWRYVLHTQDVPNGEHKIFAKIKNKYGIYNSEQRTVQIEHIAVVPAHSEDETEAIKELGDAKEEIDNSIQVYIDSNKDFDSLDSVQTEELLTSGEFESTVSKQKTEEILNRFRKKLQKLTDKMAIALRHEDVKEVEALQKRILKLRKQVVKDASELNLSSELIADIDRHITKVSVALENLTRRNEVIIKERIGEDVFKDSDKDGISDYDEVNLYGTDPFSADTDGDGFTDGSEIQNGYNPTDSVPEALVAYESPKEMGVLRDDIFVVESITDVALNPDDKITDGVIPQAVIQGKGLPNSYVTLYIYSTPIVVTIKTDDEGSWSYTFDKELEDGAHEVYVGITDNAGRIVAKSNPLPFVKTAEAFTPVDAANSAIVSSVDNKTSMFSPNAALLVLSIAVVAIGLVLILLGMHIRIRKIEPVIGDVNLT